MATAPIVMRPLAVAVVSLAAAACSSDASETLGAEPSGSGGWPDTVAAPFVPMDALLRPPPDSGRFTTDGHLEGFDLCPPCPPGAQCEPCPPDGLLFWSWLPGGRAQIRVELQQSYPGLDSLPRLDSLVVGRSYLVTVDLTSTRSAVYADPAFGRDSTDHTTLALVGLRPTNPLLRTQRVPTSRVTDR